MARSQVLVLTGIILLVGGTAASLSFDVTVAALADADVSFLKHDQAVSSVQAINATVENTGSVGCTYRLHATFSGENKTEERYSAPYGLFPGDVTTAKLYYVPVNYTGSVNASVAVEYCGKESTVSSFQSTVTRNTKVNYSAAPQAAVHDVSRDKATVSVPYDDGRLVPVASPPFWKVGATEVTNGEATIQYDAPLFKRDVQIGYVFVAEEGDINGPVTVDLAAEPSVIDRLTRKPIIRWLIASLLVNVLLGAGVIWQLVRQSSPQ